MPSRLFFSVLVLNRKGLELKMEKKIHYITGEI